MGCQSLTDFFNIARLDDREDAARVLAEKTVHLVVDVQRNFVSAAKGGDAHTERVACRIGDLTKQFTEAGVKPYWIYYTDHYSCPSSIARGGFYGVRPGVLDTRIAKRQSSAFSEAVLERLLEQNGIENLLVSGFNTSACVRSTVIDGLKRGYRVCLLKDMTADSQQQKIYYERYGKPVIQPEDLRRDGALVVSSKDVLDYVAKLKAAHP